MEIPEIGVGGPDTGDMPPEEFRRLAHETADWMADYLAGIDDIPVFDEPAPGALRKALPGEAPAGGEAMDEVLRDFRELIVPGLTHWNHPAFYGYFAITSSGPGILGEMLTAALNVNAMVWRSSPAATELEDVSTDWLRRLLDLPADFEGVINDTASSSTLHALAAAREVAFPGVRRTGLAGRSPGRVYGSAHAHSSVEKAVLTLGLGSDGYRGVEVDGVHAMDPLALRAAIEEDIAAGVKPVAIVPTLGTTMTAAIDPVGDIADLAEEFGVWLHVDAAYGGAGLAAPASRPLFDGIELADSLIIDPHKWLFAPFDCCALMWRDPEQARAVHAQHAGYLDFLDAYGDWNPSDFAIHLTRRARGLPFWFSLATYGTAAYGEAVQTTIDLAREAARQIEASDHLRLLVGPNLSIVVFERVGWDAMQYQRATEKMMADGTAFVVPSRHDEMPVFRFCFVNPRTTHEDIAVIIAALR